VEGTQIRTDDSCSRPVSSQQPSILILIPALPMNPIRLAWLFLMIIFLLLSGCGEKEPKETPAPQPQPTAALQQKQPAPRTAWNGTIFYTDGRSPHAYPDDDLSDYEALEGIFTFIFQQPLERYEFVFTLVRPSPTCDQVVLQEIEGYDKNHRAVGGTWLLHRPHHDLREIVDAPVLVKWSPNGSEFLYQRENNLYLQSSSKANPPMQVESSETPRPFWFGWSPDGKWIGYILPLPDAHQLWLMSTRDHSKRLLDTVSLPATGFNPDIDPVQWAPGGGIIRVVTDRGQVFYHLDGEKVPADTFERDEWIFCHGEKCMKRPGMLGPEGYTALSPVWAVCPSGKESSSPLGFSHDCTRRAYVLDKTLYLNDLQTGDVQKLAALDRALVGRVFWSPDDAFILFSELPDLTSDQPGKIYAFDTRTDELTELPVRGLLGVCFP